MNNLKLKDPLKLMSPKVENNYDLLKILFFIKTKQEIWK